MTMSSIMALVVSIAIPLGANLVGSSISNGGDSEWYRQLKKPSWTPPNWAFPVVWTILYILMGTSSWLVWLHGGFEAQSLPLGVYAFQLVLNFFWTPLFFGLHQIGLALVDIMLLWVSIAATMYLFWPISAIATYLLIPYLAWVSLATALNYSIGTNNGLSAKKSS